MNSYGNNRLLTPNIDQFAKKGLKPTSCYSFHPKRLSVADRIDDGKDPL
ncbi:hypothetical protein N9B94_00050 [Verrucomicrobia bacterium]|nr:hypothetical protein [Verrucomicrobiota bacterium]